MTCPDPDRLRDVPLFSGCSEEELDAVAALMEERTIAPGSLTFPNGSDDAAWFVVLTGLGRIVVGDREVGELRPGDAFGGIAMADGRPTRAGVVPITEMRVAWVNAPRLRDLFSIGSVAAAALRDLSLGREDPV